MDKQKPNKQNENKIQYMPLGMCIGISVGMALGAAVGSIPIGMCMGMSIGICFGVTLDNLQKNKEAEQVRRWERLTALCVAGGGASPYQELWAYAGEVNNGGHCQYFENLAATGDLQAQLAVVLGALPAPLGDNLRKAHDAFCCRDTMDEAAYEAVLGECEAVFRQNEQLLVDLLKAYADTLEL